jgi:hypothetical protein
MNVNIYYAMKSYYGLPLKIKPSIQNVLKKHLNIYIEDDLNINITNAKHNHLFWKFLSKNPNAVEILEQNIDDVNWQYICSNISVIHILYPLRFKSTKIDWWFITQNPSAVSLLLQNPRQIKWDIIFSNPNAIDIIKYNVEKYPNDVNWFYLSRNPAAVDILKQYPDKINWFSFSINTSPLAIELIEQNLNKVDWDMLALNKSALHILKQYPENINWNSLSQNPSEEAIQLLHQNPDKITWSILSNPSAIHLIEEKIQTFSKILDVRILFAIYENPSIFEYDYAKMKANMDILREELIMKSIHPSRVCKWIMCENEDMLE